jgi:acetoacetyl-CoA reductase
MFQRVALVTGGMGGLGEAIAERLARSGYKVAVTFQPSNTTHQNWLAEKKREGLDFYPVLCDVGVYESCVNAVQNVKENFGEIDILVNNAGITLDASFSKMDTLKWDQVIDVNLNSVFYMTKQVISGMAAKSWGRVINIASVNASKGAFGQVNYSAAKAGMHGFTKALALEVATKGITVNTVSPGYLATKMVAAMPQAVLNEKILPQIPMRRLGEPKEIAGLINYLVSEEAGFVTGANIAINGGQHMD